MTSPLPLTQYGLMAEAHWREQRPRMVAELEKKGELQSALFAAQEATKEEQEVLYQTFRKQGLGEEQADRQAWELVRENHLLLPPERDSPPED